MEDMGTNYTIQSIQSLSFNASQPSVKVMLMCGCSTTETIPHYRVPSELHKMREMFESAWMEHVIARSKAGVYVLQAP
jgi:hypothetical protein